MSYQIHEINASLSKSQGACHIQKIFGTAQTISFQIRVPGKSHHLVLGKGNHFEGIGLSDHQPSSPIRTRDRFLEYLRKNLSSSQLVGLSLDEKDRIVTIKYFKSGHENYLSVFYMARKTYMLHSYFKEKPLHFASWKKTKQFPVSAKDFLNEHYEIFNEVGRSQLDQDTQREPKKFPVSKIWEDDLRKRESSNELGSKAQKKKKRKIDNIKKDLEQTEKWTELQDWIVSLSPQVDENQLPDGKFKKFGIKFNLGYGLGFFDKKDMVFSKIKRLKKGKTIQEQRLENEMLSLKRGQEFDNSRPFLNSNIPNIEIEWGQNYQVGSNNEKKIEESSENISFYQFQSVKVGMGLSAQGNDVLRSQYSKKQHWWFHLDEASSAHVIAFTEDMNEELMNFVANCFFDQSSGDGAKSEIDLIYTQVKNLKSVKGQAGKVLYKKEKRRRFYLEEVKKVLKI